jgi:hypothetical protein
MADLTSLVGGGLKSFGIDKLSENLSPQMREFLPFAMNPQGYLVGKAVNSLADYLGYGNQVKDLQAGAQAEKDYGKEIMRDTIGDALPNSIGDFVRATPRTTDAGYEARMEALRQSANTPEAIAQFNAGFNPDSQYNLNSQNYVGAPNPAEIGSDIYSNNLKSLYEMLGQYQQPPESSTGPHDEISQEFLNNEYDFGNEFSDYLAAPDAGAATMDYGDMVGGGGRDGGKYMDSQMAKGGRVCSCHT